MAPDSSSCGSQPGESVGVELGRWNLREAVDVILDPLPRPCSYQWPPASGRFSGQRGSSETDWSGS
jgi:hypothetical protein